MRKVQVHNVCPSTSCSTIFSIISTVRISTAPVSSLYHSSVFLDIFSPRTRSLSPTTFLGPIGLVRMNKEGNRMSGSWPSLESLEIADDDARLQWRLVGELYLSELDLFYTSTNKI